MDNLKEILSKQIIPIYSHESRNGKFWIISFEKQPILEMGVHRRISSLWGRKLEEVNPHPELFDCIDEYPEGYVLSVGFTYVGWIPKRQSINTCNCGSGEPWQTCTSGSAYCRKSYSSYNEQHYECREVVERFKNKPGDG